MRTSPLAAYHRDHLAVMLPWGPQDDAIPIVDTYGEPILEYAAIRKGSALLDRPDRGVLEVLGADSIDFLERMVTQKLKDIRPLECRRSFWLNRKGRIDADFRITELGGRLVIDVDAHAAAAMARTLTEFIFAEDTAILDRSEDFHRLQLIGPSAGALVEAVSTSFEGPAAWALKPDTATFATIAGQKILIEREDDAGDIGLHLLIPAASVQAVHTLILDATGPEPEHSRFRLRHAGWSAYNVARIEAGTPLFRVDFGTDSLPHESGIVETRVSFTKGCYLGQEVVARMQSRGTSKKRLVALRLNGPDAKPGGVWRQPITGSRVFAPAGLSEGDEPVGAVTSSAPSPMLGGEPVCFAAVKPAYAAPGSDVRVECDDDGPAQAARVLDTLRTLPVRA